MNKEEVVELIKQYSNETTFLSFTKHDHPAFIKLKAAGPEIIPVLLNRLEERIHNSLWDEGNFDHDCDPWLLIAMIGELSDGDCLATFPEDDAGKLDELTRHILQWGQNKNAK